MFDKNKNGFIPIIIFKSLFNDNMSDKLFKEIINELNFSMNEEVIDFINNYN